LRSLRFINVNPHLSMFQTIWATFLCVLRGLSLRTRR